MTTLAAITLLLTGALDWAAYSPLDIALDIEERQGKDEAIARVYAARGEYEGLRLSITARKKPAAALSIEAPAPSKDLPAPAVFRMLPATGAEITGECLDVLAPATPVALGVGETAHYWIRYAVPTGAKAGVRKASIHLRADGERAIEIPVRVEVFDFELPAQSSLKNVFYLDRATLREAFNLRDPDIEPWRPIYGALGGYRLGLSLWDGSGLTKGTDTTALREHLQYFAEVAGPAALDLSGGNGAGWKSAPRPAAGQSLDPLNLFLNSALNAPGLAAIPLTAAFDYFPDRASWSAATTLLGRLEGGTSLLRVAAAPLHPAFEPVLDAWAIPFRAAEPALLDRLRSGGGITSGIAMPEARFSAAANGANTLGVPYASLPQDAADGSPYTAWFAGRMRGEDTWWQADFTGPVEVGEIVCTWLPGQGCESIELFTSSDGARYAAAAVRWEHRPPRMPFDGPTSTATLKFPGQEMGIRLVLRVPESGKLPALAEVAITGVPLEAVNAQARPIKPWLALELDTFPTTYPGRPIAEPRIVGWACWFGGFDGVLGAGLNAWPKSIIAREENAPFDLPQDGGDALFYPVNGALLPSMRLERLRDGFEDYEYLHLLAEARQRGEKLPQDAEKLLQPMPLPREPADEELGLWAKRILETRIRIGRALAMVRE